MNFDRQHLEAMNKELSEQRQKPLFGAGISVLRMAMFLLFCAAVLGISIFAAFSVHVISSAPDPADRFLEKEHYPSVLTDNGGGIIEEIDIRPHDPLAVSYDQIPGNLVNAFLAAEDNRFWYHGGIDLRRLLRTAYVSVTTGRVPDNSETITQKLVRNTIIPYEASDKPGDMADLIRVMWLAARLERENSKEAILREYLSTISLGSGCLGVHEAAELYFGKPVTDLDLSECTVLAAAALDPIGNHPVSNPGRNQEVRLQLLNEMVRLGYISEEAAKEAAGTEVYAGVQSLSKEADLLWENTFTEAACRAVVSDLKARLGYTPTQAEMLLRSGGLLIETTMDPAIQAVAVEETENPENYYSSAGTRLTEYALLYRLTVRHSDGSAESFNEKDVVEYHRTQLDKPAFKNIFRTTRDMRQAVWEFKAEAVGPGDQVREEIFRYIPQPQASVVILDQSTGAVLAITGGRGSGQDQIFYNRATDRTRQPGSSFMIPADFAPALDLGNATLASVFYDSPLTVDDQQIMNWWGNQYLGYNNIRQAVKYSMNIIAMKCMLSVVSPAAGFEYAKRFGFSTLADEDRKAAVALGNLKQGVTNLEMAAAYAAIASGGTYYKPCFYTRVTDRFGNVLLENVPSGTRIIKKSTAALLTNAMEEVMSEGGIYSQYGINATGGAASVEGLALAGKSGTTAESCDVWFTGYSPLYTCSVWAGYDAQRALGTGQIFHKQIWQKIMSRIHDEDDRGREFSFGENLEYYTICSKSGLLAIDGVCNHEGSNAVTYQEAFVPGTQPTEYCDRHYPIWICRESGQAAGENCPEELWEQHVFFRIGDAELASGAATLDTSFLAPAALQSCTIHVPGVPQTEQAVQNSADNPGAGGGEEPGGTAPPDR